MVQDKIYCFNSKDNLNSAGCTILDMENMNRVKNIEFADDEISYTFIKNVLFIWHLHMLTVTTAVIFICTILIAKVWKL